MERPWPALGCCAKREEYHNITIFVYNPSTGEQLKLKIELGLYHLLNYDWQD
jgi:hypothetical protein